MELNSAEAKNLQKRIEDWIASPNQELEATFGVDGKVDVVTFLTVAKRLRARGYRSIAQEDRMTVTLPDHVRFSLQGLGTIQEYCKDDTMAGKNFIVMIKDRTVPEANVDLMDYDVRVKVRREIGLEKDDAKIRDVFTTWKQQKKAFRVIRRWTFEGEGLVIDLSIVRSTLRDINKQYKWQRLFRDQDVMGSVPEYEIEVELVRLEGDTPEIVMKRLVKGMGEVLRGIQKHTFLIRKSVKDKVLRGYRDLVGMDRFRGVAPVTLEMPNFLKERDEGVANIRDGYNVTDKADGLRVMAFCDTKGEMYMMDMGLAIYKTGLTNQACRSSLIDGEWITQTKDGRAVQQLLFFDIYYDSDKNNVTQLPFYSIDPQKDTRYNHLKSWVTRWNDKTVVAGGITASTKLQIVMKNFYFAEAGDSAIFQAASKSLDVKSIYNTDGLIFTPNDKPIPNKQVFMEQFKWKPSHDNTIDFLVKFENYTDSKEERITVGVKPDTGETLTYKTLRLLVGSSTDSNFENPRATVLEGAKQEKKKYGQVYKPVAFNPSEFSDTMASVCYLEMQTDPDTGENYVLTDKSKEPIQEKNIVEMAYEPSQPPGWRWKPLRVRMDKTERLQRGILARTLNSSKTADSVWNSIHDPITESMIRSGSDEVDEAEAQALDAEKETAAAARRKYFERTATEQDLRIVKGLRDFHNKLIKERVLYASAFKGRGKTVLDLAVGKGADLQRWRRGGVSFVLGCDNAGDNITNAEDGAYRRYLETVSKAPPGSVPPMIFAIADTSKRLIDGTGGETEQEKDILRSVFGRIKPMGPVPPFVEREGASKLKMGADCVSLMFAIHYFFDKKETFDGLLQNIADGLKLGGYFIGCCFDGDRVFDLLKMTNKGSRKTGMNKDMLLWSITKQYDADAIPEDDTAFGMGIDVEFISIGTSHREYLVPFKLLQKKMADIGCELLDDKELAEIGLKTSTDVFGNTYRTMGGSRHAMNDAVQQFSFLNRWFIFKRKAEKVPDVVGPEARASVLSAPSGVRKTKIRVVDKLLGGPATATATAPSTTQNSKEANSISNGKEANANGKESKENNQAGPISAAASAAASAASAAVALARTVPVATEAGPKASQTYASGEVFQFYSRAALQDKLKIGDKSAARWLAPNAPFPIKDGDITYPSVEHYFAAMMYKLASNKPDLAVSLFARDGSIHQEYVRQRLTETDGGTKPLSEDRDYEMLEQESKEVKAAMKASTAKKYKAVIDETKWATLKDQSLRDGLAQRWENDARLRRVVEAVRNQGKILLFYTPGAVTNLGGIRRDDGTIEGDNKMGQILMSLAKFPGY
jgi:mRNA capping enzyme, catalytic domain/mRNA capping enzyme